MASVSSAGTVMRSATEPSTSGLPLDNTALAADLTPSLFPPEASYVRSADAKPQDGARIARQGAA